MIVGKKYSALNTLAVKGNNLTPGDQGYVTFVDEVAISLEITKRGIAIKIPRYLFGTNFEQSTLDTIKNSAYQSSAHATNDFQWPLNQ